jgi:regulatory protein
MKVTAIKQQVKRPDRYSIYIDERFSFGLSESQLVQIHLRIGQELDEQELTELKHAAKTGKLYDRAIRYLSIRMRSELEMRQYLRRKEAEPEEIEALVERLKSMGYLNDEEFARHWRDDRRVIKKRSARVIGLELRQKGIEKDVITKVLAEEDGQEVQALQELIEKKRRISRYATDEQKLIQYLMRQGYRYDAIKRALHGEEY